MAVQEHVAASTSTPWNNRSTRGDKDVRTTMIHTHVLHRGGRGVRSPDDELARLPDERQAAAACHAKNRVTAKKPAPTIRLTTITWPRVRPHLGGLQVIGGNFLQTSYPAEGVERIMRTENATGVAHWDTWACIQSRAVFLGLDLGLRHDQGRDSLAILRHGNTWQVTTVTGPGWVAALQAEIAAPTLGYAILTIDASMTRPVIPEYWQRGCEAALIACRELSPNFSWQGQSFQKVQDLIGRLPIQGPAVRVLLETHPQSNYSAQMRGDSRANRNKRDQYLRAAFTTLTGSQVPKSFPAANQGHAQHAVAAALVSVAYGRFKSSDLNKDYLATVIDHDGCYWLLDFKVILDDIVGATSIAAEPAAAPEPAGM
jgi:hypothetical protein